MALQVFAKFVDLPVELRTKIWREAAGDNIPRTIEVVIRATAPEYVPPETRRRGSGTVRPIGGPRAYVSWTWNCYAAAGGFGPPGYIGILGVNHESRHEYQSLNPQSLRLENGPRIHFNAVRDTILMDAVSIFTLHMYTIVPDHLLPVPIFMANLQGFNQIQKLQTSLLRVDYAGLTPGNGYFGNDAVLARLNYPITKRLMSPMSLMALINNYRPIGVWHRINNQRLAVLAQPRPSTQLNVVARHFNQFVPGTGPLGLLDEVNNFFT